MIKVVKVVKGLISAEDNLLLLLFDCLICLISPNQLPICQHYLLSQANLGSCDTICVLTSLYFWAQFHDHWLQSEALQIIKVLPLPPSWILSIIWVGIFALALTSCFDNHGLELSTTQSSSPPSHSESPPYLDWDYKSMSHGLQVWLQRPQVCIRCCFLNKFQWRFQ